jgi:hypothetical protein
MLININRYPISLDSTFHFTMWRQMPTNRQKQPAMQTVEAAAQKEKPMICNLQRSQAMLQSQSSQARTQPRRDKERKGLENK